MSTRRLNHFLRESNPSVCPRRGRFGTLMRSRSAIFKSRLFVESNEGTLVPWYHYIPVSIRLVEVPSLLTYFFGARSVAGSRDLAMTGVPHDAQLKLIAERGTKWAEKCARGEDQLSYAHLLVLEWARLLSDDRETEGFVLAPEHGE